MRLILATHNQGKTREIKEMLKNFPGDVVCLADIGWKKNIPERGKTFLDNAAAKAKAVSRVYLGDFVVGEDSGIEVAALQGRPGVYSKRYSGRNATDEKNNKKLLHELCKVKTRKRGAAYHCTVALARAGKVVRVFNGFLRGRIAVAPAGNGGFGYDPIFYVPRFKQTTAEMPLAVKNSISHRGKAFALLFRYFEKKPL